MKMLEVNCKNCGQHIVVGNDYLREQMFCTIGCMFEFEEKEK